MQYSIKYAHTHTQNKKKLMNAYIEKRMIKMQFQKMQPLPNVFILLEIDTMGSILNLFGA